MHVEQDSWRPAHGKYAHGAATVIRNRPVESVQLGAHVLKDAVGADRTRRILRIVGHKRTEMIKRYG
jgi:hypothetical protein